MGDEILERLFPPFSVQQISNNGLHFPLEKYRIGKFNFSEIAFSFFYPNYIKVKIILKLYRFVTRCQETVILK